ncbi:MAG: hypothetical protein K0R43_2119 [Pseudoduganella sp.]|jgi:hypothetical protein|nr:hypothetical protein [Pseudoduganella sp.]
MKKLFIAAACALAIGGCAEMPDKSPSPEQAAEKRFTEEDDFVTGSRIARKPPKTSAASGGGTTATSANR